MTSVWRASEVDRVSPPHPSAASPLPLSPTRGEGKKETRQSPSPLVGEGRGPRAKRVGRGRGNAEGLTKRQLLPPTTVNRSRELRRDAGPPERNLWRALREAFPLAGFRHQVPFGRYHADFCSHAAKLIVEADYATHALKRGQDETRTLNGEGYRVIRFWNNEVMENLDGVIATIASHLPSPLVGEGGAKRRMRGLSPRREPLTRLNRASHD